MDMEQYIGCVILYHGRMAAVIDAQSSYDGDYIVLRYDGEDTSFRVNAFDQDLMDSLPDPEYGLLKHWNGGVVFSFNGQDYTLGSHPYEPCLYIGKGGRILCTLHNAFDAYELPETFARGESLTGPDGRMYGCGSFCRALLAAIASGRPEMDFTFAAMISRTAEKGPGDYGTDTFPESPLHESPDRRGPQVMNYCPNCGKKNDGGNYCTGCGTRLLKEL